jgi:tRNA (mo5U34)-methyltransferase
MTIATQSGSPAPSDAPIPPDGTDAPDAPEVRALRREIAALGTWFHNLRLPAAHGALVQTAPEQPLGDFPGKFWRHFQHVLPQDLSGKSVLDIGCNAGFYSFEMRRRGAARVLGVDHDERYLAQAAFARARLGLSEKEVEFRRVDVYEVDTLGETFDLVLFMGVLYHLRHPLLALEKVVELVRWRLLFQTMERGAGGPPTVADDYPITEVGIFEEEHFPRLYFVEHRYAGDRTNWWIPNPAASAAMLRSCGMRIVARPCSEVYLCAPADGAAGGPRSR